MTVKELINLLQNVEDKKKSVVFNDRYLDSYASITTIRNKEHCVVLDQIAWKDNKNHYIEGEE